MGHKQSKGKISQEDLTYLMKNTHHSKKEIKVSLALILLIFLIMNTNNGSGMA